MSKEFGTEELVRELLSSSWRQQLLFLAQYAQELTVLGRGYFADGDSEMAQKCNESLHRVSGYLARLIRSGAPTADSSFLEAMAAGARQRGWWDILERSFRLSSETGKHPDFGVT